MPELDTRHDPDPRMAAVYRWRADFQNDFQARMDWTIHSFADHRLDPSDPPAASIVFDPPDQPRTRFTIGHAVAGREISV